MNEPFIDPTPGGKLVGYYVSNLIGIRTGGVFTGEIDHADLRDRIVRIAEEMRAENRECGVYVNKDAKPSFVGRKRKAGSVDCLSGELVGWKGSYVVIAGVFNYWTYQDSSEFARRLSNEFHVEVMHMCWDEQTNEVQCQIWLIGRPLFEVAENPLGRILRRVG